MSAQVLVSKTQNRHFGAKVPFLPDQLTFANNGNRKRLNETITTQPKKRARALDRPRSAPQFYTVRQEL